jgi:solute:Na+ symporter, SSS family
MGPVYILRWYWWRINPWSEISCMIATVIIANVLAVVLPDSPGSELFSVRLAITLALVTPIWLIVTFLTSRTPDSQVIEFYKKMRISGPGWKKVQEVTGIEANKGEFSNSFISWLSCVLFILSTLLGIGKFLFHEWLQAAVYIVIAISSGYILKKSMSKMHKFLE